MGVLNRTGRRLAAAVPTLLFLLLAGCASPLDRATALAAGRQMTPVVVAAGTFDLFTLAPAHFTPGAPLVVYVEGDGYAWINRYRLSDDPTPHHPLGLQLALADPADNLVYVARPCQYVSGAARRHCQPAYWSSARFAEEVIDAIDRVVTHYLAASGARGVRLTGYSGGGAVAALLAARRPDTLRLITVAGPLDTSFWTGLTGDTPLFDSLNPADVAGRLAGLRQTHLVGAEDTVVPPPVAQSFAAHFPPDRPPTVIVVPGERHDCCWAEHWPALLRQLDSPPPP